MLLDSKKKLFCVKKKDDLNQGFTLIELMVTIGIVTVMMGIILFENSKFNQSIILTNTAYEIALVARQAQVFGLSSRANVSGSSFGQGYGISASSVAGQNDTVRLFADNNNWYYEASEEITGGVKMGRGIRIVAVCFKTATLECNTNNRTATNVIFKRPNPEANIRDSLGNEVPGVKSVNININTNDGIVANMRCVVIDRSGQISVKTGTNCPSI